MSASRAVASRRPVVSSPIDAMALIERLEEAGQTLLRLNVRSHGTHLRLQQMEVVHDRNEAYGWDVARARVDAPPSADITRMDEALAWVNLLPNQVHRRIVHARLLRLPNSDRHLFSWRKIGVMVGAHHYAVSRWHAEAIDILVKLLN